MRRNDIAVLTENHGTCSTEHALLAEHAGRQRLPLALMLGVYLMNEHSTPGVGGVLAPHELAEIPEAPCYLMHNALRIDITRDTTVSTEPIAALLHEEQITPAQTGLHKVKAHQEFLRNWLKNSEFGRRWTFDELRRVQEECIAALSGPL